MAAGLVSSALGGSSGLMPTDSERFDGRKWETLGERGNLLAGEGYRYTGPRGGVRHKLETRTDRSICGLRRDWFGTGSQEEYEKLARIPKCATCMKLEES